LADADSPVLIVGELGSGRETIARLIHQLSVRSGFEFAKVNCAALPSDLLEAELFGYHRNGTGPSCVIPGKLELCEKGTILLGEIAEMPMSLQAKLLRVVQSRSFTRPGSEAVVPVDVRILISSTNNLEPAVSDNKLRKDLFYRLSTYTVRVPPVRERQQEVPNLLRYFMRHLSRQYALSPRVFSPSLLEACQNHDWPGNLREMEDFVKRFLLAGGRALTLRNEPPRQPADEELEPTEQNGLPPLTPQSHTEMSGANSLKSLVQMVKLEAERNAIAAALERTGWNRKAAARLLKVSYRTLLYKIEHYQMKPFDPSLLPGGAEARSD
jgi:transcriptional regulator with PAS, ATPase and Fis domain